MLAACGLRLAACAMRLAYIVVSRITAIQYADDVSEARKAQIKAVLLAKNRSEHAAQRFVDDPENFKQGAIKCVGFDNQLYQALVDKKAEQHD